MFGTATKKILTTVSSVAMLTALANTALAQAPKFYISNKDNAKISEIADWSRYDETGHGTPDTEIPSNGDILFVGGNHNLDLDYARTVGVDLLQHDGMELTVNKHLELQSVISTDGTAVGEVGSDVRTDALAAVGADIDAKAQIQYNGDYKLSLLQKAPEFVGIEEVDFNNNEHAYLFFSEPFVGADGKLGDFAADIKSSGGASGNVIVNPGAQVRFTGVWGEDNTGGGGDDERVESLVLLHGHSDVDIFHVADEFNTMMSLARDANFSKGVFIGTDAALRLENGVSLTTPDIKSDVMASIPIPFGESGALILEGNNTINSKIGMTSYQEFINSAGYFAPVLQFRMKGDAALHGSLAAWNIVFDKADSTLSLDGDLFAYLYQNVNGGSGTIKFTADNKTLSFFLGAEVPDFYLDAEEPGAEATPDAKITIDFNNHDSTLEVLEGLGVLYGHLRSTGGNNGTISAKYSAVKLHSTFDDTDRVKDMALNLSSIELDNNLYLSNDLTLEWSEIIFNEDIDTVNLGGKFSVTGQRASTVKVKGDLVLPTIHTENDNTLRLQMSGAAGKVMEVSNIQGSNALKSVIIDGGGKLKLSIKDGKVDTMNNLRFDEDGGELYLYHNAANKEDQIDLTLKANNPFRSDNAQLTFGAAKIQTTIQLTEDSSINDVVFDQIHLDDKLTLSLSKGINLATRRGIIDSATNAKLELLGDNIIRGKVDTDVILASDGVKIYGDVILQNKLAIIDDDSKVFVRGNVDSKLVFQHHNQDLTIDGGYTGVINNYSDGDVAPSSTLTFAGNGNVAIDRMNKMGGANFEELYFVGQGKVILPDASDIAAETVYVAGKKNIYWGQANQAVAPILVVDPGYQGAFYVQNQQSFNNNMGEGYNPISFHLTSKNSDLVLDDTRRPGVKRNRFIVNVLADNQAAKMTIQDTNVIGTLASEAKPLSKLSFAGKASFKGDAFAQQFVQLDNSTVNLRRSNLYGDYKIGQGASLYMNSSKIGNVYAQGVGSIYFDSGYNIVGTLGKAHQRLNSIYVGENASVRLTGDVYAHNTVINTGGRVSAANDLYIQQLTMNHGAEMHLNTNRVELGNLTLSGQAVIGISADTSQSHGQLVFDGKQIKYNSGGTVNLVLYTDNKVAEYSDMALVKVNNVTTEGARSIIDAMKIEAFGRTVEIQDDNSFAITGGVVQEKQKAALRRLKEEQAVQAVANSPRAILADVVKDQKVVVNIDRKIAALQKVREASAEKQKEFVIRLASAMEKPTSAVAGSAVVSNASTSIVGDMLAARMGGQAMPVSFSPGVSAGLGATPTVAAAAGDEPLKYGAWMRTIGGASHQKITKNISSGYKGSLLGGVVGFDVELNERQSVGLALGHIYGKTKMRDTQAGDRIKNRTNLLSLYGQHQINDQWFINGSASYAMTNVSSFAKRVVSQNDYDVAVGEYKVKSLNATIMSGYNFMPHESIILTPTLGLRFANTKQGSYSETGAESQNLTVNVKHKNNVTALAGLSLATRVDAWGVDCTPEIHSMLNYKMGSKYSSSAKVGFVGDDDTVFSQIESASRYTGNLGGSITVQHKMMEYSFGYDAQFGKKYIGHQGSLRVKVNL